MAEIYREKPINYAKKLVYYDYFMYLCIINKDIKYMYNTEEFIRRARLVHGNKYDYSKALYVNSTTDICIICPIHGEFWQRKCRGGL